MAARRPDIKIGMLARDCSQRALKVLTVWNQVGPHNVKTLNINCCPSSLKKHADCSYLKPESSGSLKQNVGMDNIRDRRTRRAPFGTGAAVPMDVRISKVYQVLRLPQYLPGLFLQRVQPGTQRSDRYRGLASGGPHFSSGEGSAHGRPLHRLWAVRGCLPDGYPAASAVPEGQ